jgi:hypothetical protein
MKSKISAVIVCLMLTFCLAACKGKAQKAKVETIEGVTYVHNPASPLHPTKAVIFEEELIYKDKDETGEVRLFNTRTWPSRCSTSKESTCGRSAGKARARESSLT